MRVWVFHERQSVNESVIEYFYLHSAKEIIKRNPYDLNIEIGLHVVLTLTAMCLIVIAISLQKIPTLSSDNFITRYQRFIDLHQLKYRVTGTLRQHTTEKYSLTPVNTGKTA